tara:strand:+ start:350 stop:517 length:168 start_codon:yes stop_codon:yes gene_type:complete
MKKYSVLELSKEADELFGTEDEKRFEESYDKKLKAEEFRPAAKRLAAEMFAKLGK